jgi:O-antigen/teichoic acid export membrane protein
MLYSRTLGYNINFTKGFDIIMHIAKKIVKNSGFLLIKGIATKAISFFILLYIARYLGPADFGVYSFAFAFIYFFSFIPDLGIHQIIVREAAKDQKIMDQLIGNATIVKLALSILSFFFVLCSYQHYRLSAFH